jgi:hypothetical protein
VARYRENVNGEACDFLRLKEMPASACPDWSAETYTTCLENLLDKRIAENQPSLFYGLQLAAFDIGQTMKFRKENRWDKTTSALRLLDFNLHLLRRLPHLTSTQGLPAASDEREAKSQREISLSERGALVEYRRKAVKALDRLLKKLSADKNLNPQEQKQVGSYEKALSELETVHST